MIFVHISVISNAQNFDINTLKKLNVDRNTELDKTMNFISNSATPIAVLEPMTYFAIGLKTHNNKYIRMGFENLAGFVINGVVTYGLKTIINRPRPYVSYPFLTPLGSEQSKSFPSGHTSLSFYEATNLSLNCKKWYVVVPSYLWASSVAYSRMHKGVHYPSDVLVGALVGSGSAYVLYKLRKKINHFYDKKKLFIVKI
jgi:membrane-associated phospholipid phosphatase